MPIFSFRLAVGVQRRVRKKKAGLANLKQRMCFYRHTNLHTIPSKTARRLASAWTDVCNKSPWGGVVKVDGDFEK